MTASPPLAPKRPHIITQHGQTRTDEYFWLRHRDDPAVLDYLAAENNYTRAMTAHTRALQAQLFAEMRGRIKEDDSSVPEPLGDYLYYERELTDRQYPLYCRRRGSLDAPEEVVLDVNALAEGQAYCRLGAFEPSPDNRWLAYSVDYDGDEVYTLLIKDLQTGEHLPEQIPNTYYGVEWANDSRTLFYSTLDPANRPHQIHRHRRGTDPAEDVLIHHEADEAYFVWMRKTKDQAYLLINLQSMNTSEWRYARAAEPEGEFRVVEPRRPGVEYAVHHHDGRFLIVTNDGALNFRLVEAPAASPGRAHWREVIPHRADVLLDSIECFRNFVVRHERQGGLKRIRYSDPHFRETREVAFPEPVYTYASEDYPDFESRRLRIAYSSLVTPDSIVDYDLAEGRWIVLKVDEIPSGYDPAQYASERLTAAAPDGTSVPISVVYRRGLRRDGRSPALLYGYGSYGATVEPGFNANRLSLLDRGFVFAVAHVRGGAELGRAWYDDGKLLRKKNSFGDFIACAEHLIAQGYTSADRLAITGTSAGGLLVGAAMTMRPDLFACVVARVPFVDVINSMNDPGLPLTVTEWEQWGNPADREAFEYMLSYSPYDNVTARAYPHLLVTAGLNDPRVMYWEPAKWTARLRASKTGNGRLLLKTNMGAGHAGSTGRFDYLDETAFEYAFILDAVSPPDEAG